LQHTGAAQMGESPNGMAPHDLSRHHIIVLTTKLCKEFSSRVATEATGEKTKRPELK